MNFQSVNLQDLADVGAAEGGVGSKPATPERIAGVEL